MKRILITGANSYIGINVENWLKKCPDKYSVETIDMIDGSWREKDFSSYDCIYHVSGIAHSDNGKISAEKEKLYRSVNTDLTVEVAKKAKADGVKQFIFMSSAIVYGDSARMGKTKMITKDTQPTPNNCYSDSKWQAELGLRKIASEDYKVCVLRPPMIYGKGSKGNYPVLAKFALKLPIFPKVNNARSMLYIENLCEFVRLMIDNEEQGVFWPQNKEYSNTTEVVRMIAKVHGKSIKVTGVFNWGLHILRLGTGMVDKAFGNLAYDQKMSEYKEEYRLVGLGESIRRTEG
jgi:UDP-glucose 4-epimerase